MSKILVKLDNGSFALCEVLAVLSEDELATLKQNIDATLAPPAEVTEPKVKAK